MVKDESLVNLARTGNVAQFVSFSPTMEQRFSRVQGFDLDYRFRDLEQAATIMLLRSPEKSVNIRSYEPENPKSRDFLYGLKSVEEVVQNLKRLAQTGLYTIINETVDVNDGGVSGVMLGNALEFAPGDTPRCVEKPGTLSLPRDIATHMFNTVYGFMPELDYNSNKRVEFSIHPMPRGFEHSHTIVWEHEEVGPTQLDVKPVWPNKFSRLVGDKTFGLLMAHSYGLDVPYTLVFPRKLAAFSFGYHTGCAERWLRTCPTEQQPGKFTTVRGWVDPFKLMAEEDPTGEQIAAVLAQNGVAAAFSGACIANDAGMVTIEGAKGYGDSFMLGGELDVLPQPVIDAVTKVYNQAASKLGPVRFEWVMTPSGQVWVVQFHRGASTSAGDIIYPGHPEHYAAFAVEYGLEKLRSLIQEVSARKGDWGIELVGKVGITSHFGDVLRKAKMPSRIAR